MSVTNKLSTAEKQAIASADPSISNRELAEKYGVKDGTIWYHRHKAHADKSASTPANATRSTPQLRHTESNRSGPIKSDPIDAIFGVMDEAWCDAAWSILAAQNKAKALQLLIANAREARA